MRIRPTVRLLIVDEHQRILMFKIEEAVSLDPTQPALSIYWVTPGGGVEGDETFEQAGLRELWEETGIRLHRLGPLVWLRDRVLYFPDEAIRFQESYFLVLVSDVEVSLTNLLVHELASYRDHRWWSLAELEQSDEFFFPPGLAGFLRPLLAGQIPVAPILLEE